MDEESLCIKEVSPEDYTENDPEYDDEQRHWVIVHTSRDLNGDASTTVYFAGDISSLKMKRFEDSDYRIVERLTDKELVERLTSDG